MPDLVTTEDDFAVTERGVRIPHTKSEVDRALELNALFGGQSKLAIVACHEEGLTLTYDQLKNWAKQTFHGQYLIIRKRVAQSAMGERIAGDAMEIAAAFTDAEWALLQKLSEKIDKVPADKLAASIQQIAMAKDRNIENARLLRNEPTMIVEDRNLAEIAREMENLGIGKVNVPVIDLEAEEVAE